MGADLLLLFDHLHHAGADNPRRDGDDSQVQLSGRLSPNLLLSYGVGVLTPVNTLTLRYNLTERFYVETAQSVESALDFFYTFDF